MKNTWLRSVLGLGAVLLVAGPGMVLAVFDPSYTPRSLVVQGPGTLAVGATANYTAFVTFTNGQTATVTVAQGTIFSVANTRLSTPTTSGQGVNVTGVTAGLSGVQATFTQQGVQVGGIRFVRVTP